MARHIQGKDGKMAGSIGDAKDRVPTPSPLPPSDTTDTGSQSNSVDTAAEKYRQRIRQLAINTDTELAQLDSDLFRTANEIDIAVNSLHHSLGHRYQRGGYAETSAETVEQARQLVANADTNESVRRVVTRTLEQYDSAEERYSTFKERARELNGVWLQHRWTRAYLVPDGHVHSNMDCSTCNKRGQATKFVRLPQYSGGNENDIVEDAGERACTVCYPSAPVDVLARPTRIYSDEERQRLEEAEQRRTQREANRAAKAAKAPTASGEPLVLAVGTTTGRDGSPRDRIVELKTERTALTFAVDILAAQRSGHHYLAPYEADADRYGDTVNAICDAVAEKRGVTRADILAELEPKAAKRIRQYEN